MPLFLCSVQGKERQTWKTGQIVAGTGTILVSPTIVLEAKMKSARQSVFVGKSITPVPITDFDTQNAKTCMHMCLLWNWLSAKHHKSLDLHLIQGLPQCAEC